MSNFNPIPPTKKELKQLKKQYEKERLERLNKLDDKKLTAVLHYYKGTIQTSQYHVGFHKLYSDEKNTWNSVVMFAFAAVLNNHCSLFGSSCFAIPSSCGS